MSVDFDVPFGEESPRSSGAWDENGSAPAPFLGQSHAEVLAIELDDEDASELIAGILPRGVVAQLVGLPETYKGWIAAKASAIVAGAGGELFGRSAASTGPVGYFWQDDSTRQEIERVQLFARVHETPADLPLRWYLNEGLSLPADLERLRATIEHFGLVLVVLDSVYNVTAELDLKDREVGQVYARLKSEVCDPTGCSVLCVDHMPWATENNRKRLRAYGDVFKGAAARVGIYVDVDGKKVSVEVRGNAIEGFRKTPAYWDADALELRLVDTSKQDEEEAEVVDARVLEWLVANAERHSTTAVRKGVGGRATGVDSALERLLGRDEVRDSSRSGGTWSGRSGDARYWIASVHAENTSSQLFGTRSDEVGAEADSDGTSSRSSRPRRGDEVRDEVHVGDSSEPVLDPRDDLEEFEF